MKPYWILAGIMLAALGSAQAETFRWKDATGKVHYGDMPPADAAQIEQKKFSAPATNPEAAGQDGMDLGYETRRAQQNFPVTLYYASNCSSPCEKARAFLNKRGIPFAEKLLRTQEEIDSFQKESGSDQSPTLLVGKTWLKAFTPDAWTSELDIAGYPKFAPYRPQAATPAARPEEAPAQEPAAPPQ